MNYKETLEYISSITWMGSKPGLERVRKLLNHLGKPQDRLKFIHIAGTNGKGSTASMLSFVLEKADYKTGLFTSPYVNRFNERMQINNVPISDEELAEIATYIRPFAEQQDDLPTEFEINTAIAMEFFARNNCDIVVLEVGMGGELDSTNIIDTPELAIITVIGMDHIKELGNDLISIAKAKAGIIKDAGDVLIYPQNTDVEKTIIDIAIQKQSKYYFPDFQSIKPICLDIGKQVFKYKEKTYNIPLIGTYQLKNAAMVIEAIEILKNKGYFIPEEAINEGLCNTKWPGRFEVLAKNPVFIVDGAHNQQGIKATASSIQEHFDNKKITFLMGVMSDKDVLSMLQEIIPLAREIITVTPDNSRALSAKDLAAIVQEKGVKGIPCSSVEEAIETAIHYAGTKGVVCAIGSLYLVGDVRKYFKKKEK